MIEIWTALVSIFMLKAIKTMAKYQWHLSNLVAFIRLNLFVKINLQQWIDKPFETGNELPILAIQCLLF
jgi:hypothetical protein